MTLLSDLEGKGWVLVDPPEDDDVSSVVARYRGTPIRAGFCIETLSDGSDGELYEIYRSGLYDISLKLDFEIGRGQVRVDRAEGYEGRRLQKSA